MTTGGILSAGIATIAAIANAGTIAFRTEGRAHGDEFDTAMQ